MGRRRRSGDDITGILLLDKPAGLTSAGAVRQAAAHLGIRTAGHTGTLDPAATGLLVVCTGYATRLITWLQQGVKGYRATIRFGFETTTADADGEPLQATDLPKNLTEIVEASLSPFRGVITQRPPSYSALRMDGKRLHELARAGEIDEADIPEREVEIQDLELLEAGEERVRLDVRCSPGTYIRSLAVDLGRALGSAAHLEALRRYETGGFTLEQALPLKDILAEDPAKRDEIIMSLERALPDWRRRSLDADERGRVLNGGSVPLEETDCPIGEVLLLMGEDGRALAVAEAERAEAGPVARVKRLLVSIT